MINPMDITCATTSNLLIRSKLVIRTVTFLEGISTGNAGNREQSQTSAGVRTNVS
jgi:hypothetical protein